MADRPGVQTATFAFTLPISCQICLGKVKQPVVCPNQHVFCQQCMDVWLMHNQQCPTCRVEISVDNPCKRVLGGLSGGEETSDRDSFSTKEVRKARLDVIFNEYEREIERLQSLVEDLSRKNEDLKQQLPNQVGMTGAKPQKGKGSDVDKLLLLTSKLQDATSTYEAVVRDMAKLKEENAVLREKNSDLSRMNDQLRMELNKRTPQKYGRFTVATLEAKVAQYEKENAQLQRALERSDQHTEDLEKQLENYKKNHNMQQEQRRAREKSRSKSPELDQEKHPAEKKWNPVKFDHSKEHQVSVSSSQTRHLPDPEVSPISQPLQFWRNPADGNADLVPSWLRTDHHWPETDSGPAKATQHEQGSGDSFMLEKPSPLTPATCIRHLTIGHKTESLSQDRKSEDTSYKTKDTSSRRAEESSHSSGSSHNSRVMSRKQRGENTVTNNQSARSLSPERHSGESVTSSGKARRKLRLGTDGEKVRKSLFSSRETSKEESSGQYTSQDIRDTSSASNSLTDRDSTSSKTWNQHRFYWAEQILLGQNDQDLGDNPADPREKSEHLVNKARNFPSKQLTKNFNSVVGKDREASVGAGPSGAQAFFHTRANLDGKDKKEGGSTSQWLFQNGEESDDEDREVASKTANQSLLDLDITLTPNMKDVYMMMKQAERRVGERRKADGDLSYQRPPSCDARLQTRDYDVYKPVETSRNKTAHFEPKPRMPRSNSAPVLDRTDLRNASSSNDVTENPDASSKGRENRSQSSSLWQSNTSNCDYDVTSNVHIHDRGGDHGQKTYPAETHNMARNRNYDGENTERHTKPSASSHPWAFRDTSSSFSTAQEKPTFSRRSVTQEQTQAPEIKKPMHPTILECFGEGTSSGDRSRDSDIRGYQSEYKGMMDRETVGENFKKRKPRGPYSESPTKSPKWK